MLIICLVYDLLLYYDTTFQSIYKIHSLYLLTNKTLLHWDFFVD